MNFKTIITLILVWGYSSISAQCGFETAHQHRLDTDSLYQNSVKISNKIIEEQLKHNNTNKSSEELFIIPVVVHVLHLGEPIGTGFNISDEQIQSSIDNLNDVYRGRTTPNAVDFKIEFRLAQQTIDCEPTNGINRIDASGISGYSSFGLNRDNTNGANESDLSQLSYWPADKYFNIWTVTEIDDNNGGGGVQGYAYFFTGNAYEGSFMMANQFGYDPNHQHPDWDLSFSRDNSTPVHEFGHYLHLHHTFKGDNNATTCPADVTYGVDSDGCADTEPHIRNIGTCPAGTNNNCTGSTFNDNAAKNFMNYCTCPDRFTNDQKTIVRTMLSTTGASLIESEGENPAPENIIKPIAINCSPQTQTQGLTNQNAGILKVKYANMLINSNTADRDQGYIDFSAKCIEYAIVDRDVIDTIFVTTFTATPYIKIWIDTDNSGDYSSDELFFDGQAENNEVKAEILLPESTILNEPLRVRIINDLSPISDYCYNPIDGQVEDYTVFVTGIEVPEIPIGFPQSFSPNGDGINDFFVLKGSQRASSLELRIFDKFGNLVYQTNNINGGWNGTYKGKELNPDVYKYIGMVTLLNGTKLELTGNITLVR